MVSALNNTDFGSMNGHDDGADPLGALGYRPAEPERSNCSPTAVRRARESLRQALLELSVAEPGCCADLLDTVCYDVGRLVRHGFLDRSAAADALTATCTINGLAAEVGPDVVQEAIASGFRDGALAADAERALTEYPPDGGPSFLPPTTGNRGPQTLVEAVRWPTPGEAVFHGIAGRIAGLATQLSEIDPIAVVASVLIWAGALFGRGRYFLLADEKHHPRLFATLVGASARARKGTSLAPVRRTFDEVAEFGPPRIQVASGLSTGEGLVASVRDKRPEGDTGGVEDKRQLIIESEMGRVLRVAERQGNTISALLREAYDGNDLSVKTKAEPLYATAPHICLLGHITRSELGALLSKVDVSNGFANRFMWICVKRRGSVPFPQGIPDAERKQLAKDIANALDHAEKQVAAGCARIDFTLEARQLWAKSYPEVTKDHPGILGEVTTRAESQVLRLALTYALLDKADAIWVEHLEAALAFQRYAFDSARFIFASDGAVDDPVTAKILEALAAGERSSTDLRDLFDRNLKKGVLSSALAGLQERGRVVSHTESTGGRPRVMWSLGTTKTTETTKRAYA